MKKSLFFILSFLAIIKVVNIIYYDLVYTLNSNFTISYKLGYIFGICSIFIALYKFGDIFSKLRKRMNQ